MGPRRALGIVTTGSSVGALVLSPALQAVIDAWDWRTNQGDCRRYDDRRLKSDHD